MADNTPQPTALCEAIRQISNDINALKRLQELEPDEMEKTVIMDSRIRLLMFRSYLIRLLPREREQMEGAYLVGTLNDATKEYRNPEHYFTQNYTQE